MKNLFKYVPWVFALYDAYVFLWYLQFKFTGNPGSVELFTTLTNWLGFSGYEKVMRIGVGTMELVASVLLLIPITQVLGAVLAMGIMSGAIFFHVVSPLGIDPYHDGAVLFTEACCVWLASAAILTMRRQAVLDWLARLGIVPKAV